MKKYVRQSLGLTKCEICETRLISKFSMKTTLIDKLLRRHFYLSVNLLLKFSVIDNVSWAKLNVIDKIVSFIDIFSEKKTLLSINFENFKFQRFLNKMFHRLRLYKEFIATIKYLVNICCYR